jgi:hypothetical protein
MLKFFFTVAFTSHKLLGCEPSDSVDILVPDMNESESEHTLVRVLRIQPDVLEILNRGDLKALSAVSRDVRKLVWGIYYKKKSMALNTEFSQNFGTKFIRRS